MGVMIDYNEVNENSLSPFFGAGSARPVDFIYRNEGTKISAAGLVDDAETIDNDSQGTKAVVSAQISGIAGYNKYQGQVQIVKLPL